MNSETITREAKTALKSCPLCPLGGNPKLKLISSPSGAYPNGYYWVGCEITLIEPNPGCGIGVSKEHEADAIAQWNTRATPTTAEADEGLRAAVRTYILTDPADQAREWCAACDAMCRAVGIDPMSTTDERKEIQSKLATERPDITRLAREVGFQITGECPYCKAHQDRDPCCASCAAARVAKEAIVTIIERVFTSNPYKVEHKCQRLASALMDDDRDWWAGELLEPVPEWPKETHCLHMKTPLKDVTFLCNRGDFEQLMVLSDVIVDLQSLDWLKAMSDGRRVTRLTCEEEASMVREEESRHAEQIAMQGIKKGLKQRDQQNFSHGYEQAKADSATIADNSLPIGADDCVTCERSRVIAARIRSLAPKVEEKT